MRRLLVAAGLAFLTHGLLLLLTADHFRRDTDLPRPLKPIRLALIYKSPERRPVPVLRIPRRPEGRPPPPKKEPEKTKPKEKPPKIERIRPVVEKPLKKEPMIPDLAEPAETPALSPAEPQEAVPEEPVVDEITETVSDIPPAEPEPQKAGTETVYSPPPPPPPLTEASPLYRKNPVPEYPGTARRRGYEGTVILEVLVNEKGRVDDLRLYRSSGYALLDRAAMRSVKEWLFTPGRRGEQEVAMWVRVPVRFELR